MFPNSSESLLQDTKDVQDTPVSRKNNTKFLIFILVVIFVIGLIVWKSKKIFTASAPATQSSVSALEPTSAPLTNTFVDSLFGTVLLYRDGKLYSLDLPNRTEHVIVGVGDNAEISLPTTYPPTWSPDGKLVAVTTADSRIVVTEFDTGRYKGTFPMPAAARFDTVSVSIDPASEVIAIATLTKDDAEDSITFYSLLTQKELGVYPRCSGKGVWMTGVGYATTCLVGDAHSVTVVRFEPSSSLMTPLARETSGTKYQVFDEYKPGILLLKRTIGSKKDLLTLDANGKLTVIPQSEYKAATDVDAIVNASDALKARIQATAKTKPIKDVSVSSDNDFFIFETDDGLYAATLDLKSPPYFLGTGTMPRVRPN